MKFKDKMLSGNECLHLHIESDCNSSGQVGDADDDVLMSHFVFCVLMLTCWHVGMLKSKMNIRVRLVLMVPKLIEIPTQINIPIPLE